MGTTLTGKKIKDTYKSLVKVTDNSEAGSTGKQLSDGNGNDLGLFIDTDGVLGIGATATVSLDVSTKTDALGLPKGTDAQRVSSAKGHIRYNTTDDKLEFYDTDWRHVATESYVNTEIANVIDTAPSSLDTLNEIAAALNDDANFYTTITNLINAKQATLTAGDITFSLLDPTAIVTESEGISSNDNDTTLPTSAAVKDYVDGAIIADTNTTYTTSAVDSGDDAIIRLTGSDASTDDVKLVAGSNITITPVGDDITISAPSAVDGTGVANKLAIWSDTDTLTNNVNLHWDNTNNALGIGTSSEANTRVLIHGYGSSGTTNALHIKNVGGTSSSFKFKDNGVLDWGNDAGTLMWDSNEAVVRGQSGKGLRLAANGVLDNHIYIATDGDVGIGTNTPDAKLDVDGTIAFNSLKDTGEDITITKFVDEADTIASNNNDTTIPTSAAVDAHIKSKSSTDRTNNYKIMGLAMDYLSRVNGDGGTVEGMENVMKNTEELILA